MAILHTAAEDMMHGAAGLPVHGSPLRPEEDYEWLLLRFTDQRPSVIRSYKLWTPLFGYDVEWSGWPAWAAAAAAADPRHEYSLVKLDSVRELGHGGLALLGSGADARYQIDFVAMRALEEQVRRGDPDEGYWWPGGFKYAEGPSSMRVEAWVGDQYASRRADLPALRRERRRWVAGAPYSNWNGETWFRTLGEPSFMPDTFTDLRDYLWGRLTYKPETKELLWVTIG